MTLPEIAAGFVGILFLAAATFGPMWLVWRFSSVRQRIGFRASLGYRFHVLGGLFLVFVVAGLVALAEALLRT